MAPTQTSTDSLYIAPTGTRYAVCLNRRPLCYFDSYLDAWRFRQASRKVVEVR